MPDNIVKLYSSKCDKRVMVDIEYFKPISAWYRISECFYMYGDCQKSVPVYVRH